MQTYRIIKYMWWKNDVFNIRWKIKGLKANDKKLTYDKNEQKGTITLLPKFCLFLEHGVLGIHQQWIIIKIKFKTSVLSAISNTKGSRKHV